MATTDNNIIAAIPTLSWRGLRTPPYDVVTFAFENELAPRGVAYVDGEMHDATGRRSYPMTARLYFLNTLGEGGNRMFPELWEEWKANLDGEAGDFVHPVLGPLRARVKDAKGEIRSTIRSGVIVDITWVETIEDPAGLDFERVLEADPSTLAAAADRAGAVFGIGYPKGRPDTSLLGAYNRIKSALFSAKLSLGGALAQLTGTVETMIDAAEGIGSPTAWPLLDILVQFWTALRNQAARLARAARPTKAVVLANDTSLDAFATRVGNTLNEIMGLNLQALRLPIVRRGSTLRYYS